MCIIIIIFISFYAWVAGACPGGGAQGAWAPPLEIEKQKKKKKKKKKKVIRANIKLFHLYFANFFSRKYHFLSYFLSWAPPLKN